MSFEEMCEDKDVTGAALREIINYGKAHKLEKFEIPGNINFEAFDFYLCVYTLSTGPDGTNLRRQLILTNISV